ncbi:MAG: hypothetical protein WBX15_06715 [Thermoanaerobaculia bacterium]
MLQIVIDEAGRDIGCSIARGDLPSFLAKGTLDEATIARAAAEQRIVPEAVLRVLKGEEPRAVWEAKLSRVMTLAQFEAIIPAYGTREQLEAYLAKDFVAMTRETLEKTARRRATVLCVRRMLEARAAATGITPAEAADEYVDSLVGRLGFHASDPRFIPPKGREVFF